MTQTRYFVYCIKKTDRLPGHQIPFQVKKNLIRYSPIRALKSPNVPRIIFIQLSGFLSLEKKFKLPFVLSQNPPNRGLFFS
jgi:hypothetical protein